ncbi:hypothetical protein D3C78_1449310 [compost metagenome]
MCGLGEFAGGRAAGDDAPGQRVARGEGVVTQQQVQGALGAQHAGQAVRHACVGRGAQLQICRHEAGVVFGNRQVACQHQRQARARRHAVHLRQPKLVHAGDARDEIVKRREQILQGGAHLRGLACEHADVAARAEGLARRAQAHDTDGRLRFDPLRGALQVARHGDVDGVERVGAVQRDRGDGSVGC